MTPRARSHTTFVLFAIVFLTLVTGCGGGGSTTTTPTPTPVPPQTPPPTPVDQVTVTLAGTGTGVVTSTPAGINCGTTCTAPFPDGTTVQFTAAPSTGSTFAG